jgi:predicted PurR-regulated permease PerM
MYAALPIPFFRVNSITDDEHARALEEQWIDSLDNAGTATMSQSQSSNSSVLEGIVVGFFFPILPFFFMRKPKVPAFWEDGSEHESPGTVIFS